jgi:hypothetical protein
MSDKNCSCKKTYTYEYNSSPYPYKSTQTKNHIVSPENCTPCCQQYLKMWRDKNRFGQDIIVTKYPNGKITKQDICVNNCCKCKSCCKCKCQ